ncbi:hypothetical protein VP01_1115g2 [Puccinia sorghi]|uniref:Lysophospholipase n=1 Tax=Puccinia sorghi TaxID=27349 RepID=A0A0L6VTY8_9BASI|nr:hypothetical protein VP01_1115g2 [Puccinia sorghi]
MSEIFYCRGLRTSAALFFLALWIGSWTPRVTGSKESCHWRRDLAIEASPSGGYEPMKVRCRANFGVRVAGTDAVSDAHWEFGGKKDLLSDKEVDYIMAKAGKSSKLWETYLTRVGLTDFDIANFTARSRPAVPGETLPNIGIAMSGGGIRALIGGAGILDAFDNRNPQAVRAGTAGILQLTNYITGTKKKYTDPCILSISLGARGWWDHDKHMLMDCMQGNKQLPYIHRAQSNCMEADGVEWIYELELGQKLSSGHLTGPQEVQVWLPNQSGRFFNKHSTLRSREWFGLTRRIVFEYAFNSVESYTLSRHLINDTHHGSKVLFSSIRNTTAYKNHQAPFPILLCTSREAHEYSLTTGSTASRKSLRIHRSVSSSLLLLVFLTSGWKNRKRINKIFLLHPFNPVEFGVCHPTLKAYIPLEDLGSQMIAGKPAGEKYPWLLLFVHAQIIGFDNAGFVIGASSNVLSQPGFAKFSWADILPEAYDRITDHIYDEAIVSLNQPGRITASSSSAVPCCHPSQRNSSSFFLEQKKRSHPGNPFYRMGQSMLKGTGYPEEASQNLYLADGGWGGEILPLWPLLQPERKMDVIIAIDFSADGPSMFHGACELVIHPNGTSLFTTYMKTQEEAYKNIPFPKIPDPRGPFSQRGLNKRPSFFGCNENHGPIIIYFPNYFVVANTNHATMKTNYNVQLLWYVEMSERECEEQKGESVQEQKRIATQTKPGEDVSSFESDVESVETILGRAGPISHTAWKQCLACALTDRQLTRDKIPRSPQCQRCFAKYCA